MSSQPSQGLLTSSLPSQSLLTSSLGLGVDSDVPIRFRFASSRFDSILGLILNFLFLLLHSANIVLIQMLLISFKHEQ